MDYELRAEARPPTLAELGLETYGGQKPTYRGMKIEFGLRPLGTPEPHPFADWKFQLPVVFWPAIRRGSFAAGDVIYNNPAAYAVPWGEALQLDGLIVIAVLRASPAVGREEGKVFFRMSNASGGALVSLGERSLTQREFCAGLEHGFEPRTA